MPKLSGTYRRIADPDLRKQVLDLVQMLAEQARTISVRKYTVPIQSSSWQDQASMFC
jgi:hypothetical protein